MDTRVQKWGNSLAVRIPKPFASEVGLHPDAEVELEVSEGRLVITPHRDRVYHLSSLLAQVFPSNLHCEQEMGGIEGTELW